MLTLNQDELQARVMEAQRNFRTLEDHRLTGRSLLEPLDTFSGRLMRSLRTLSDAEREGARLGICYAPMRRVLDRLNREARNGA